jgi:coronin-1B/1C/6
MSKFVRNSRFRHVFGTGSKREAQYDSVRVSRSAWDTNIAKVNSKFLSVNLEASGGGQFQIIPLEQVESF